MMNKEINIEDLRPIAIVDYATLDEIKEFVNLLLGLGGGSKTFDDYFEASLVHNGMTYTYYDDEDDWDDEDYDDEDYDDEEEEESEYASHEICVDGEPYKKDWDWMSEDEKVEWSIDYAYENQDDTPIFPHVYISRKTEEVPDKLMEYMKKLVYTGINEICIGDAEFVDKDSRASSGPSWY